MRPVSLAVVPRPSGHDRTPAAPAASNEREDNSTAVSGPRRFITGGSPSAAPSDCSARHGRSPRRAPATGEPRIRGRSHMPRPALCHHRADSTERHAPLIRPRVCLRAAAATAAGRRRRRHPLPCHRKPRVLGTGNCEGFEVTRVRGKRHIPWSGRLGHHGPTADAQRHDDLCRSHATHCEVLREAQRSTASRAGCSLSIASRTHRGDSQL